MFRIVLFVFVLCSAWCVTMCFVLVYRVIVPFVRCVRFVLCWCDLLLRLLFVLLCFVVLVLSSCCVVVLLWWCSVAWGVVLCCVV